METIRPRHAPQGRRGVVVYSISYIVRWRRLGGRQWLASCHCSVILCCCPLLAVYEALLVFVFLQLAWGALAELVHVSVYHEAHAVVEGGIVVMPTVEAVF